jgi:hypothetical protein
LPTRHLPSSGFLTLLTVSFLRNPPALFHAGHTLEVSTFRAFSSHRAFGLSRDRFPSCRWPPPQPHGLRFDLAFRALLPVRIRHSPGLLSPPLRAATLLVFPPSRGLPLTAPDPLSRALPSWASPHAAVSEANSGTPKQRRPFRVSRTARSAGLSRVCCPL